MAAIETERTANGRKTAAREREARGKSGGRWAQRGAKRAGGGCWESSRRVCWGLALATSIPIWAPTQSPPVAG